MGEIYQERRPGELKPADRRVAFKGLSGDF
jgi:hypothetical protein